MTVRYVELADRVLRVELTPDTPGWCPDRQLKVDVVSGPLLEPEEADRIIARAVAELVSAGAENIRWAAGGPDNPEPEE